MILASVGAMSTLPAGASSTKPLLKSGPIAAMLMKLLARAKAPWVPCPCCSPPSTTTDVMEGLPGSSANSRKPTITAGEGSGVAPTIPIELIGKAPGIRPYESWTNSAPT